MAGDIKEFKVNYDISSQGNAGDYFKKLAKQASESQKTIANITKNITDMTSNLGRSVNNLKEAFKFEVVISTSKAEESLKELEKKTQAYAARIRKDIASALNGQAASDFKGTTAKAKKSIAEEASDLRKEIKKQNDANAALAEKLSKESQKNIVSTNADGLTKWWYKNQKGILTSLSNAHFDRQAESTQKIFKQLQEGIKTYNKLVKDFQDKATQISGAGQNTPSTTPITPIVQQTKKELTELEKLQKVLDEKTKLFEEKKSAYNKLIKADNNGTFEYSDVVKNRKAYSGWINSSKYRDAFNAVEEAKKAKIEAFNNVRAEQAKQPKIVGQSKEAAKAVAESAKETKKAISETITASEKGLTTLENLQKPTEALSVFFDKYGKRGGVTIKVHANISEAIRKINTLLSRIESQGAVIPVTLGVPGEPATKSANSKAFSETKGQLTEAGKQRKAAFNSLVEKQKNQTAQSAKIEAPGIVKQLTQTVSSLNSQLKKEPLKVYATFDGSNLLGQLQTAIASLKEYAKANPILLNANISKAATSEKGSKAIPKGKKGTVEITKAANGIDASREKIQSKASEKPIVFRSSFNGGDAAFQANMAIQKIQELVSKKPIILRSVFNGGDAAFQANTAIARIQKLVGEKPIIIRSSFNGGDAAFQAQQSLMKLQKLVDGKTIAVKGKLIGIEDATTTKKGGKKAITMPVNIKAQKLSSQINSIISDAKKTAGTKNGITIQAKFSVKGITGKLSKLLKDLQAKANANPIKITTQFSNGDVLAQLNTTIGNLQKATEKLSKVVGNSNKGKSRAAGTGTEEQIGIASRNRIGLVPMESERVYAPKQPSLYARMRASLYPFTGNTSFGARTPAMVEMAKGMGTMFAVGGAMSAVGSSLSQAVSYQNTMKTAQAILQNGTNDYTPGDFNTMTHTIRQVGKDTKFTAPDVANAARFMAMAGLHTKDITAAIRPVADVALIGDTDLGTTADKLTNVMTTFGLNAKQMRDIADIMTSTFTRSNTDMLMLAESAKYAGGIAHLYGKSFKNTFADTMALFGVLGNAGIQASSAGTTIRMMYQNLMQPNKNQLATLKKYNIYTRDKNGEPLEMRDILAQISAKVPQNKMADAIGQMFRITAQPGAAALASNMPMVTELIRANEAAAGSGISQNIANEKKGTLAGLWAQVTSSFTEAVVQAMENRQEKWTKMLGNVRDFLSDPETIKGISAIIDLVEVLAKTMMQFAKLWAGAYIKFPKIINFWLQAQMVMTQFGYLLTPIVQIIGLLNNFKGAILGVGGALGAVNKAAGVGEAVGIASGIGGIASDMGAIGAPIGMTRFGIKNVDPSKLSGDQLYFLRQYNGATRRYGAEMKGLAASKAAIMSSSMPKWAYADFIGQSAFWAQAASNPQRVADKAKIDYSNPSTFWAQAALNPERVAAHAKEREEAIAHFKAEIAQKTAVVEGKMAEERSKYLNTLKSLRRPEQMRNLDLISRYGSITGNGALVYDALRNRSHAERMSVAEGIFMRGGKNASLGLKMGFKEAFKNAKKFGSINAGGLLASMMTGIKTAFFGLMKGLAAAVGFLVSPVGLAIAGLATLTIGIVKLNKAYRKHYNETIKNAIRHNKDMDNQIINQNVKVQSHYAKLGIPTSLPTFNYNPLEVTNNNVGGKQKAKINPYTKWGDVRDEQNIRNEKVNQYLSNLNAPEYLAYDNTLRKKYTGEALYGKNVKAVNSQLRDDYIYGSSALDATLKYFTSTGTIKDSDNEFAAAQRARVALIAQAANSEKVLQSREKMGGLFKQYQDKKITYNQYISQAKALRNQFNPNQKGLLKADSYTAEQINASDPTRFDIYQRSAFNILNAELLRKKGSISGYYDAINKLKGGMKEYTDQWWDAVAHLYEGMKSTITVGKRTITVALRSLPNGSLDFSGLVEQIKSKIKGLGLTLSGFSQAVASIYQMLSQLGAIKGSQYFKTAYNFVYGQIKHTPISKEDAANYWDKYIKHGNAKATWKGLNREQYINAVSSNKSGDSASIKQERDRIRIATSHNTAIALKKQQRKIKKQIGGSINNDKPTPIRGTSNGTVSGSTGGVGGSGNKGNAGNNQKDYASTYDRSAARPTQVIITIDKLCNFDRTMINKDADSQTIAALVENKISEAVTQLSSILLNQMAARVQDAAPNYA